jgi:hypothetical protein
MTEIPGMDSTMPVDPGASSPSQVMAHSTATGPALLPVGQALLLGRPPPEITLPPAKQHLISRIEILGNGTLLLPKFLNLIPAC